MTKPHKNSLRLVDLNSAITEVAKLMRLIGGAGRAPKTMLDPLLGRSRADAEIINRVLVSLATSALSAMAQGGRLVISTARTELDAAAARELNVSSGTFSQVEFAMTGSAIEVLPVVHQLLQEAHGAIFTRSDGGPGTTVTVLLPKQQKLT
jgi:signal transduction histidine kinase